MILVVVVIVLFRISRVTMGRLARKQFKQNGPEAVDIGALVHQVDAAEGLFRGHIGGRSQGRASARGIRAGVISQCHRGHFFIFGPNLPSQPPIQHDRFAIVPQHDIVRLQIAMNDSAGMCIGDRIADINKDTHQAGHRERILLTRPSTFMMPRNGLGEALPLDQLHRIEGPPASIDFVHWHNVGVL